MANIEKIKNEWNEVKKIFEDKEFNFVLDPLGESHRQTYENLTYLLSKIYKRSDWATIAKSWKIRAEDVFQHKIKVAARKQNIPQVVDKLCNLLGLQSVEILSTVIDNLQGDSDFTLRILRRESIYITRKAMELSAFLKTKIRG